MVKKQNKNKYWANLLAEYPFWLHIWLEDFEVPKFPSKEHFHEHIIHLDKTQRRYLFPAWNLLLHRYSDMDDIVYQYHDEKTMVVRSIINSDLTFNEYIKFLNTQVNESLTHVDSVAESVDKKFFANLGYQYQTVATRFTEKYLTLINTKEQIKFIYDNRKFSLHSIEKLAEHLLVIINKIQENNKTKVTEFEILTAKEKTLLFKNWQGPHFSINKTATIPQLFLDTVQKYPNNTAINFLDQNISYAKLNDLANQLANMLLAEAVEASDVVAVVMDRSLELIVAMIAIWKIGAIYVPINPTFAGERIRFILNDCRAKAIIASTNKIIPEDLQYRVFIYDNEKALALYPKTEVSSKINPQHTAYIVYSSGKTQRARGIIISHHNIINLIDWYKHIFNLTPEDRSSQFSSQAFDTFFCETLPFLCIGASVHIVEENIKFNPIEFISWIQRHQITVTDLPIAYAQILFAENWPQPLDLRIMKVGGEPLTRVPLKKLLFDVWNTYGPTEATIETTLGLIYHGYQTYDPKETSKHLPPPIGKPIGNAEVYVVDSHLQAVPIGVAGELLIGGLGLSGGYYHRENLTAENFIDNPFAAGTKVFKTGDLVRWLDDGNLQFIDKLENQIKLKGFRVALSQIQVTLSQFPEFNEVFVIAKDTPGQEKKLIACLVPNLQKLRLPYQSHCLLQIGETQFLEVMSEDISVEGLAISGLTQPLKANKTFKLQVLLPGRTESQWLNGNVVWQKDNRAGIKFFTTAEQQLALDHSIQYYLATHNVMEMLQNVSIKRNLRHALLNKLPAYMIPDVMGLTPKLHLSFSGKIDWRILPLNEFEDITTKAIVPPTTATQKKLAQIWSEILGVKTIGIMDSFFDLGGSSLQLTEFFLKTLQEFKVKLSLNVLLDLPYIKIIAEYIDSHGERYARQSPIQSEIKYDVILPEDVIPARKTNSPTQSVLLTGAGGFIGSHVLQELYHNTQKKIYCILKKNNYPSAQERLQEIIKIFSLDVPLNDRIVIIDSFIGAHKFGISTEMYERLADGIELIYHCGTDINHLTAYDNLRASNVLGTLEVIKFSSYKNPKPIHYVSSFDAASHLDTMGNYIEDFTPNSDAYNIIGGFALTKWVAERLLTQIMHRNLPVSIYRCGYLSGDSQTGICSTNDIFLLLVKGCIQLGYAPNWEKKITFLPIDFASKAIVTISESFPTKNKVLHLDHPQGVMWVDWISWLNAYGYKIQFCSLQEWGEKLSHITPNNALYRLICLYMQDNAEKKPYANMSAAMRMLDHVELVYPRVDSDLLKKYIDYLCRIGFLPAP